jgi:hypothetical protein
MKQLQRGIGRITHSIVCMYEYITASTDPGDLQHHSSLETIIPVGCWSRRNAHKISFNLSAL